MPTGTGAVVIKNLPSSKFAINPALFNTLTSKNVFDPVNFALPAFGNYYQSQLLQVGIVSKLRLLVTGTLTTTGTTVTIAPTAKWPWGLISQFTVSGNGQNDFIACDGWDLHVLQICRNRALVDTISSYPTATNAAPFNASGSTAITLQYEVPIAMDDNTLIGSLYAQSEATNLAYKLQVAAQADLFTVTAGGLSISATVYMEETIFEVPYDPNHPDTLIIPDLTVLHGVIGNDNAIGAQLKADTQLYRIQGQLERLIWRQQDAQTSTSFWATANYNNAQLIYGANQVPYYFSPMNMLRIWNQIAFREALTDGVFVIDATVDNTARDQILLEGVTNLRLHTEYGTTPATTSSLHWVQETLFA